MHWALADYMHVTLAFNDKFPSHVSLHPNEGNCQWSNWQLNSENCDTSRISKDIYTKFTIICPTGASEKCLHLKQ